MKSDAGCKAGANNKAHERTADRYDLSEVHFFVFHVEYRSRVVHADYAVFRLFHDDLGSRLYI